VTFDESTSGCPQFIDRTLLVKIAQGRTRTHRVRIFRRFFRFWLTATTALLPASWLVTADPSLAVPYSAFDRRALQIRFRENSRIGTGETAFPQEADARGDSASAACLKGRSKRRVFGSSSRTTGSGIMEYASIPVVAADTFGSIQYQGVDNRGAGERTMSSGSGTAPRIAPWLENAGRKRWPHRASHIEYFHTSDPLLSALIGVHLMENTVRAGSAEHSYQRPRAWENRPGKLREHPGDRRSPIIEAVPKAPRRHWQATITSI
jgi:hypothetical protein